MYLSFTVAIKFTFTHDTKQAAIDRHFRLVYKGQKSEYSIPGSLLAPSVEAEESSGVSLC